MLRFLPISNSSERQSRRKAQKRIERPGNLSVGEEFPKSARGLEEAKRREDRKNAVRKPVAVKLAID
jgi:hypothetical protein